MSLKNTPLSANPQNRNPPQPSSLPSGQMANPFKDEHARLGPKLHAATDLIWVLLDFHKASTNHESHRALSHQVFSRSRTAYDAINTLVTKINKAVTLEWDDFESYSGAIPPLEKVLLSFFYKDYVTNLRKHVPAADNVLEGIRSVEQWVADREMLFTALTGLRGAEIKKLPGVASVIEADYDQERRKDDLSTLVALQSAFSKRRLDDRGIVQRRGQNLVSGTRTPMTNVLTKLTSQPPPKASDDRPYSVDNHSISFQADFSTLAIKSLMLLYLPFLLLEEHGTGSEKPLSSNVRATLMSDKVWTEMKSLAENLLATQSVPAPAKQALEALEAKYSALKTLLLGDQLVSVDTTAALLKLIKLSTAIRRPFHGRTVALLNILYSLDQQSKTTGSDILGRNDLLGVMEKTCEALKETSEAFLDVKAITLSGTAYDGQTTALESLLGDIKGCGDTLKLSTYWQAQNLSKTFSDAVDDDKTTLTEMIAFLKPPTA